MVPYLGGATLCTARLVGNLNPPFTVYQVLVQNGPAVPACVLSAKDMCHHSEEQLSSENPPVNCGVTCQLILSSLFSLIGRIKLYG